MKFDLEKELLFKPAGRVELSGGGGEGAGGGTEPAAAGWGGGGGGTPGGWRMRKLTPRGAGGGRHLESAGGGFA